MGGSWFHQLCYPLLWYCIYMTMIWSQQIFLILCSLDDLQGLELMMQTPFSKLSFSSMSWKSFIWEMSLLLSWLKLICSSDAKLIYCKLENVTPSTRVEHLNIWSLPKYCASLTVKIICLNWFSVLDLSLHFNWKWKWIYHTVDRLRSFLSSCHHSLVFNRCKK